MALKRKTSLVKNPPKRGVLTVKTKTTKRRKRNSSKPVIKTRRRVTKRNPAAGQLFGAFATALVINGFDAAINRIMPSLSGFVRTAAKFGGGYVVGKFGNRMPLIGSYANLLSSALYLAGALDVVQTYVMPSIMQFLAPPPPPALPPVTVKQLAAGEMSGDYERVITEDGQEIIFIDDDFEESAYQFSY